MSSPTLIKRDEKNWPTSGPRIQWDDFKATVLPVLNFPFHLA